MGPPRSLIEQEKQQKDIVAPVDALSARFQASASRRLLRVPANINDPVFADAAVAALEDITATTGNLRHAAL